MILFIEFNLREKNWGYLPIYYMMHNYNIKIRLK